MRCREAMLMCFNCQYGIFSSPSSNLNEILYQALKNINIFYKTYKKENAHNAANDEIPFKG